MKLSLTVTALAFALASLLTIARPAAAQPGTAGHLNYNFYTNSSTDQFTDAPSDAQRAWMRSHFAEMTVFSPYFDSRTSWFPNASVYFDLYAIYNPSPLATQHPDWILRDPAGRPLYIPWGCGGGTCPQYAANIANPAFRGWWINQAKSMLAAGNYPGLFIDDVNMEFRVGDNNGSFVTPLDTNTGQPMTWEGWRSYIAVFTEQIRAALPAVRITENSIWFSNPTGTLGQDQYVNRQIATASKINMERGIASDDGLTGGTGFWSVYNWFSFVDTIHSRGKPVNFQENQLSPAGQEYGLASYFLVSAGSDTLGDETANPNNWFTGYTVDLGAATTPRTYSGGVFRRSFAGGMVLLGEPGLGSVTVSLPGTYKRLDGSPVTSVTVGARQGIVLRGTPAPPPPPPPTSVTHYLSDLTPTFVFNGWGTPQKDRSIGGNTITLNGVGHRKGLGLHAYAEQRFSLTALGGCTALNAVVGVDDEVGAGRGNVDFQVWADGFLLYDSGFMQAGNWARNVKVSLAGRGSVAVVGTSGVFQATTGIDFDHVDWADVRITCAK